VASRCDRCGLLILKIRLVDSEPRDSVPRFVARITTTLELGTRDEAQMTASSVEEVLAIVRDFVNAFRGGSAGDSPLTKP
jgi:hypothetical protein